MKKLLLGPKSASSKDKQKPSAPPEATPPTTGGAAAALSTSEILLDNTHSSSNTIPPMVWKDEPEMSANILSAFIFLWIQPMFSRAAYLSERGLWLQKEDLPPLANMDKTSNVEQIFQSAWLAYSPAGPKKKKTTTKKKGESPAELESRLLHALIATSKRRIIEGGIYRLINSILQFSFPILLNLILGYYQDLEAGVITKELSTSWVYYKGYWYSLLLMLFIGTKAVTEGAYFHKMNRCSWRIKTAVSASIYRKSLRLSSSAQRSTSLGEIVNLMQVDATKIEVFIVTMHTLWDGLFQIAGYMTILGFMIGWPCLVGLLLITIGTPIMGIITSKMFGLNRAMVRHTDERVKTSNEALQGILCVKMYTWEEPLSQQIDTYRQEELHMLRKIAYLRAFSRAYMSALPTFAAATTFLVYVYATAGDVSASIIFSSIVAFDMLRLPLMFYPNALAQYAQAKVSLRRVATFLGSSEVNTTGYTRTMDAKGEIIVDNATLYWYDPNEPLPRSVLISDDTVSEKSSKYSNKSQRRLSTTTDKKSSRKLPTVVEDEEEMVYPKPILNNVNIHVSTGELCAIVGSVGSGKSTLCSAILNEAVLGKDSHICLAGSVAYVSQTAWILNRTVRENILFGQIYDESRYNQVIDTCCLRHDLQILEDGDLTEIGERGINLSGGQKQRVSLARAAYANADVYIFDDPLSALDPEVAENVFDGCILGMLQDKTRLLVTNQLQFLSKCDSIIALGTHGYVLEQGSYNDLLNNSDGEVTRLLKDVAPSRRSLIEGKQVKDGSDVGAAALPAKENKKLISNEERQTGTVKFDVYLKYIKAGGGYALFSAIFFFYLMSTGSSIGSSVWISVWTADSGMGYANHSE
jgi:ABC-type multidrug transport system fused ATPase/permease subunit